MKTTNAPMFCSLFFWSPMFLLQHRHTYFLRHSTHSRMSSYLLFWPTLCLALSLFIPSLSLSSDGILLLSLKDSVLTDPFSVLQNWNYDDLTPCGWTGVKCTEISYPSRLNITEWRVTSLILRGTGLIGSIPNDVGMIEYLASIDLSSNGFNESLPTTIFNSSTKYVNLSGNSLWGAIPSDFGSSLNVLDLSLNRLNVSLPANVTGGISLSYFNLSHNMIPGQIPLGFATKFSENATVDLSFNNLSGSIPDSSSWGEQKSDWFAGNVGLCGKPLRILCTIPSTLSTLPNSSATATATPAIAVIPKQSDSVAGTSSDSPNPVSKLRTGTIVGITMGDLAGVGAIAIVILYTYQTRRRKPATASASDETSKATMKQDHFGQQPTKSDPIPSSWPCLRPGKEEISEYSTTSESGDDHERKDSQEQGVLVMVDGETRMEADTLLKASAYVLGTSASSIVYKAMLENGITYAVRRIGECRVRKLKEFESAVRGFEKVRHPNVVRVRGFYWGKDEKLLICDYAPNGSLAAVITHGYTWRNASSSQIHLTLVTRLKIARGIARGLAYVHEKKLVHGRIKPSNILLNSEGDEPLIGDLGLEKLVCNFDELTNSSSSSLQVGGQLLRTTSHLSNNPYQPPEARDSVGPFTAKHDVYSYGVVLLELLTGWPISDQDIAGRGRALEMVDPAIRDEVMLAEDVYAGCFEVAMRCASSAPQRRPSMKEVAQIMEKIIPKLDLGSTSK